MIPTCWLLLSENCLNVVAIQLKIEELLKMLKYYYKSSFAQKKDDP